ncbi:peptidoglycan-recognition protein SC1a/b isoform X2 [Bactrocera dorsalis]|uniref:Peptidoglycan-recognition protein SC1a/b isoform X2 n=1 Tax=Bactrocera dorsalis TaxID=27457 RepID=A0ABM3K8A5_BACDO|nr:peptidoglycan-recognition protein SC1a/b isoform X2 [Bactrocera dorsalis]
MNPNVVLICRDCNTFSLSADKSHQKFLQPVKYCTNLENPPEPFCENVIWLCQNCYHSAVKSVNRDNNDCKSKSESRNQIETRYTNLIDLEKRIEALERHLKACPDLVQRESRPNSLLLISRDEWSAQTEPEGMQKLQLPIERIIIAHISTAQCENRVQCDARVRDVQAFHIHSNGWGDIGYNFLVGGDGLVYEGRGWYNQGAHTAGYNGNSICIGFIGTFNVEVLTENDLKAAQLLIDEGVRLGVLTGNYRLYGARQLSATESPGKALYSIIMKWPHWSRSI